MENTKDKEKILNEQDAADKQELDLQEEEQSNKDVKQEEPEVVSDETGIIAKDTKVKGDIITLGNLAIYGDVAGNIDARGDVIVTGRIDGSIKCANLNLDGCRIKADLNVEKSVMIENNAALEGQIDCRNLSVSGQIKGNITAGGEVTIYSGSQITGDIKAKSLGMEPGSQLCGNLTVVR